MRKFYLLLPTLFSCLEAGVNWEKRTLTCDVDDCLLSTSVNGSFHRPNCRLYGDGRHECNIECDFADRDSVISKFPNGNRKCIRFYTYNTKRSNGGWYLWRSGRCSQQKITFEVHCGVPFPDILSQK